MSITADIAAFICDTGSGSIPPAARDVARRSILDTIGVALAGRDEPAVRIVRELTAPAGADGPATLLGWAGRTTALDAALVNGTAAHALDYDDTHASVRGHPSAPIVAAALAAAETAGASGAQLVDAYLIGLEVAGRAGRSLGPSHAARGFHSTGTLGVLGATAASARLLGLDPPRATAALGIAASSAAGLRLNFGSMTKPLHAGQAARAGLLAGLLALRQFGAADGALDAGGFTSAFSGPDGDPARIGGFDGSWQALDPGVAVKKYPCCNRGHRAADAILALVAEHGFGPADVERIEVRMPAGEADAAGRVGPMTFPRPRNGLEAKFSMPYVVAAAVADRELVIGTFHDDSVRRPAVAELLGRVHPVSDERRPGTDPAANYVEVVAWLRDGRELARRVAFSRGDPRGGEPLSWAELTRKYADCAAGVLPAARVARSAALIERIDELDRVSALTAELFPARAGVPEPTRLTLARPGSSLAPAPGHDLRSNCMHVVY
jgi:2-methylcitrate dehydratase PrpD